MQNMSAENYFRYRNPKPTAIEEMIEVETSIMQVSKMQSQNNFEDNPNIENVIKRLENQKKPPIAAKVEEKVRTRKFKKALNTHGARCERIEMVKGLNSNYDSGPKEEEKKKPLPVPEELESTMTHKEIEEFSTRFNITW